MPIKEFRADEFSDYEYTADEYFTSDNACWCCGSRKIDDDDNICSHCRAKLQEVDKHDKRILEYYYENYFEEKD